MEEKAKHRIYFEGKLQEKVEITLQEDKFYHITKVLRARKGHYFRVFNAKEGEFLATVIHINKTALTLKVIKHLKSFEESPFNIHIAFSPLKKDANNIIIEQTTELGVHQFTEVITDFTSSKPLEKNKFETKVILSSEQCKRLDVPKVNSSISLRNFIEKYKDKQILWLNEKKLGISLSSFLTNTIVEKDIIFLFGAEGGFSNEEFDLLSSLDNIVPCFFNTNILKAQTAIISAIINFKIIHCNF